MGFSLGVNLFSLVSLIALHGVSDHARDELELLVDEVLLGVQKGALARDGVVVLIDHLRDIVEVDWGSGGLTGHLQK